MKKFCVILFKFARIDQGAKYKYKVYVVLSAIIVFSEILIAKKFISVVEKLHFVRWNILF